jgi:hypothetical protein
VCFFATSAVLCTSIFLLAVELERARVRACAVVQKSLQRQASDDILRKYVTYSIQSSSGHEKKKLLTENGYRNRQRQPPQYAPVMRSISRPGLLALSYEAGVGLQMLADMHHEELSATS